MKMSTIITDRSQVIISVTCTLFSDSEYNSLLISAGIWYQKNPVGNLHDTCIRNRRQKMDSVYGDGFWGMCHGPTCTL